MAAKNDGIEEELERIRLAIEKDTRLLWQARADLINSEATWRAKIDDLQSQTSRAARDLEHARIQLKKSEEWWDTHSATLLDKTNQESQKLLVDTTAQINATAAQHQSKLSSAATNAILAHAPGALSSDWAESSWLPLTDPGSGEWIRVGVFDGISPAVPIVLPLSAGVWRVNQSDPDHLRALVRNTILRLVTSFDAPLVRTLVYDPDLILDIGSFAALRTIEQLSVPPPLTSIEDLESKLATLVSDITDVHDRLTANGFDSYWSALAAEHPLALSIPIRLLVIAAPLKQMNHRDGEMSQKGAARLKQVRKLAANHGLLIIEASTDDSAPKNGITITLSDTWATTSAIPGVQWAPDAVVSDDLLRSVCTALVDRPRPSLAPNIDFRTIIDSIVDPWTADGRDGLEVPIGLLDTGGLLNLSLRSAEPSKPHLLIAGANGSGKTNALYVLIHSLAARYSPDDLQLVLVDLKTNTPVAFEQFRPHSVNGWLPHLRALGPQFDPDYSVGMLRWVISEMEERSRLLSESSTTSLDEYYSCTGNRIPRLVVVVDEFHRLFEEDSETAANLLEHIARTGRAWGIHLIMSSQHFSRVGGLTIHKDAIFGQFHNRIALQCQEADMKEILSPNNNPAAKLKHSGQIVLNDAFGEDESGNATGTLAVARDGDYLRELRRQWYNKQHGQYPSVFNPSVYATWLPEFDETNTGGKVSPAVGLPIGIETRPTRIQLEASPNQALAVVGPDRSLAIPILVRAVLTAAKSLGGQGTITLLDGDSPNDKAKPWIAALMEKIQLTGVEVERVERTSIPQSIIDLAAKMNGTKILVPIALDSIDLALRIGTTVPRESLAALLEKGSVSRIWTIGWWQSLTTMRASRPHSYPDGIRAWAFCEPSQQDLKDICGMGVDQPRTRPRFVWFDRNDSSGAQRLVPFDAGDILEGSSIE